MFAFGGFQASSFQSFRERRAGTEAESGTEETEETEEEVRLDGGMQIQSLGSGR